MTSHKQFWAVIPAAGVGKRMGANRPKQYLPLQDKTVIEHSLDRLLQLEQVRGAVLALDEQDAWWPQLGYASNKPVLIAPGGSERCHSVLNALRCLQQHVQDSSDQVWALVHDAARPCVRAEDLHELIDSASHDDDGGLLGLPVRDTMKRQLQNGRVQTTVDRTGLWHALTPQMFKLDILIKVLEDSLSKKLHVTDDASAMELAGYHPLLVPGHEDNIKVTRPFDLTLANLYLKEQAND